MEKIKLDPETSALVLIDLQHGIVGLGKTLENALRAFDSQYLSMLRPPEARPTAAKARVRGRP